MSKIKISAVSYTNTLPFLKGIKASDKLLKQIDLSVDVPSECARKVIKDEVDLGIIPVAALSKLSTYHIISDYCIGSVGAVNSVFIYSDKPIDQIKTLKLDEQSRTSNGLARILIKNYWKVDVKVVMQGEADACVLIGDRTFDTKKDVPYVYDLGKYWQEFTGLPFAYAVWVSKKSLPESFVQDFNEALETGVSKIDEVINELEFNPNFDFNDYFKKYLHFILDDKKRNAIDTYLKYYKELEDIDFLGL